jgi:hypothetical protein
LSIWPADQGQVENFRLSRETKNGEDFMKWFSCALPLVSALLFAFSLTIPALAQSTISCPAGEYDMLDWMTMDSDLRNTHYMTGTNPMYTTMDSGKFYVTKGADGYPWDINLYDDNYIYLWITEYDWNNPDTYKKFTYNTNMPLVPRCAKGGFPGSTITVPNTSFETYSSCTKHTTSDLQYAVNQVWGPYDLSLGGSLPAKMPTLVISYRYNCDAAYNNCANEEAYYLSQQYGIVQWIHYELEAGAYVPVNSSLFNQLESGSVTPYFPCF